MKIVSAPLPKLFCIDLERFRGYTTLGLQNPTFGPWYVMYY